ncbi:LANO_0H01442g1_1 [Lachancea nothofagi CBS 11611]|uniref:LANO_0H01442g1_1 n=1 Tax=Lachancea nothofagi CBS 11611 TaxID=1266666 RepID=A0A1G4KL80_9SACH|nr:LANO_0H01442g1_1 [Lachancea nothofagi CBS 11611]
MSTHQVLQQLEQDLFLPSEVLSVDKDEVRTEHRCKVRYGIVPDASMLDCGCILSQRLFEELIRYLGSQFCCPVCQRCPSALVGPVKPLRMLYKQLQFFIQEDHQLGSTRTYADASEAGPMLDMQHPQQQQAESRQQEIQLDEQDEKEEEPTPQKQNLISLFHTIASSVSDAAEPEASDIHSLDNASNTKTVPIQDSGSFPVSLAATESPSSVQLSQLDEEKEFYFAKCFPMYRKRSQFNTHSKFLRAKSKQFISTAISPDCTKFALITEHKWEVYKIPQQPKNNEQETKNDNNLARKFGLSSQPKKDRPEADDDVPLLFCGKSTGEYGESFENLKWPSDLSSLHSPQSQQELRRTSAGHHFSSTAADTWEHLYCVMSNDILVVSGTKGRFRVFDLKDKGVPLYTYASSFPIRCIDVDPKSSIIACGITGSDRATGAEQALILFHQIEKEPVSPMTADKKTVKYKVSPPITTTLPYRDPINTLQFSPDSTYISCSTALESRFLVISLRKIHEPRLVMKSLRSIDTSLESEGITDTKMFPGNSNLMCVTSVAFNTPPIVINTRIQTINVVQSVAQPTMLLRLDELGSKIHKCEISPRNDSIAFLDRNGTTYIMYAPTLLDHEKRRVVSVDVVANASRVREAASLKFSADGHRLYILDRKGSLYIEDFAYGLPQNHEVTKCKQIN